MNRSVVLSCLLFIVVSLADQEHSRHGAHSPLKDQEHYKDGEHNPSYDHESILGSRQEEKEYDDLEPEEAKRRLAVLIKRMDKDGDGYVSSEELHAWILTSFKMLDEEEAEESFEEQDQDNDEHVTWDEYINKQYNYKPEDVADFRKNALEHKEILEMIDEDKLKFIAADLNKDGKLSRSEYSAFYHPYDYEHMHQVELDRVARSSDKDKDGFITWEEYLGDRKPDDEMEGWERQHFKDYDKNKDGKLDREEMKGWVLPDNQEVAKEEVTHLLEKADRDPKDGKLSFDEILDNHDTFVGSQATDYGRHLHEMREEL